MIGKCADSIIITCNAPVHCPVIYTATFNIGICRVITGKRNAHYQREKCFLNDRYRGDDEKRVRSISFF